TSLFRSIAINIGIDDCSHTCAFKLFGKLNHSQFGRFSPAFNRNFAALGVDADGDLSGKCLTSFNHQCRITHSNSAEDHTTQPLGKPVVNMGEGTNTATKLNWIVGRSQNCLNSCAIDAFTSNATVPIDHMQPLKPM